MAAAAWSMAADAKASGDFPGAVQDALKTCNLQCTLCHTSPQGGPDRINGGFGEAIRSRVTVGDENSIPGALRAMEGPDCSTATRVAPGPCDSDGDLVPDVEELRENRDPNVPGAGNLCGGPAYGCGARVARGSSDFDWVALLIAGVAAATLMASARRSGRSS